MAKFFVFLFLFSAFVFVESRVPPHPPNKDCCCKNEVWKDCHGCDGCCVNPKGCCGDTGGPPGCYCKDGFVRDFNGKCIPQCNCKICKCNEELKCGNCDPTCKDPKKTCCCACRWDCFCKDGYVRDKKGNCIPLKDCCHPKESKEKGSGESEESDESGESDEE